jgi:hypothetical protein
MKRLALRLLIVGSTVAIVEAQTHRVDITFAPQRGNHTFDAPAEVYRQIWAAEGSRIIAGMERITKLRFPESRVKAEIYEGPSFSGRRRNDPMRFRASYQAEEKKGTLVHELGHRMNAQLRMRPQDLDEHQVLFLYLYDLYVDLYGSEFADRQVAFSRTLKGLNDYDAAWNWALAMSREDRFAKFGEVVKANHK